MLPDTNARVRGSEIDSDGWTLTFAGHTEFCRQMKRDLRGLKPRLGLEVEYGEGE